MKKSLKFWVLTYGIGNVVLSSFLFISFRTINRNLITQYDQSNTDYEKLNSYYEHVETSNSILKNYLVTKAEEDYHSFEEELKKANQVLLYFTNSDSSISWRFQLLKNMQTEYEKSVQLLLSATENSAFQKTYSIVIEQNDLIINTKGSYYQQLTDQNLESKEKFVLIQRSIDWLFCIILLGIIITNIVFVYLISRLFARPLSTIISNMQNIKQGNFELEEVPITSIETDLISKTLFDMANQIKHNLEYEKQINIMEKQLLEIENQNLKRDEQVAQSELYILQSQINPHFLFNTMNMVYISSCNEKAKETSVLLEKMCDVFRYALDILSHSSDLKSEIYEVESFLYIQRKRIGERISFIFDIEDNLPNIRFPGMIIQPLVENAVMHGLKSCTEGGEVLIRMYQSENAIMIGVSDNGIGMNSSNLEQMLIDIEDGKHKKGQMGIYYVVRRITSFYKDNGTVSFHTSEACGFEIIVQIVLNEHIVL